MESFFRANHTWSLEELERIVRDSEGILGGFSALRRGGELKAKAKQLPDVGSLSLVNVFVTGALRTEDVLVALDKGRELVRNAGHFHLTWHFQERESKQSRNYSDSFWIHCEGDTASVAYNPNASKISMDRQYGLLVLEEMIRKTHLPMRASWSPPHIGIRFSDPEGNAIHGPSTDGFECKVAISDTADLLRCAEAALDVLSSPTRYGIEWTALSRTGEHDAAKALYTALQAADIPARSYDCRFELAVESLGELAAIRPLVKPGAEIEAPLWGFDLPEDEFGEISVVVKPDGYDLEFFIPDASRPLLESELGLKLVEAPDEDWDVSPRF